MNAIDALSQMLSKINKGTASEFVLSTDEPERTLGQIQAQMQSLIHGNIERKPTEDFVERIRAAVHACRLSTKLDSRQMWLACKGCAMLLPPDDYMLMADKNALKYLLQLVEEERVQPLFFVKLYGRLLKAYFGHSNTPDSGESGRECLRKFLFERMEVVAAPPRRPSWVKVIAERPSLLQERPGHLFAEELLHGNWTGFKSVCEQLGLTGETWLSSSVLNEAACRAIDADDAAFKRHLPILLQTIGEPRFASLRDNNLAKLIERYRQCKVLEVHDELRDHAVKAWKNPWLPLNETSWGKVSTAARQMIISWLKDHFIFEFFNRLDENGHGDRDRFMFWRRYLEQIDDMYFVLGRATANSSDENIKLLIQKLEGRLRNLAAQDASNNAFVMLIGNAAIVEFSQTNNATYIYDVRRFPISLNGNESINISDLRSQSYLERLIHRMVGGQSWQRQFEQKLFSRFGLSPDSSPGNVDGSRSAYASSIGVTAIAQNTFDEIEFNRFLIREGLRAEDLRPFGGYLWILSQKLPAHAETRLEDWGFKVKSGRGWYLEDGGTMSIAS